MSSFATLDDCRALAEAFPNPVAVTIWLATTSTALPLERVAMAEGVTLQKALACICQVEKQRDWSNDIRRSLDRALLGLRPQESRRAA